MTVTVPRQRTTGRQTTWQSLCRNRDDCDVDLEDSTRHPPQRVYSKHLFSSSRKKQTYSSAGLGGCGLRLLASNNKTRTRNIIAFFFSCYAFSFLLLAPTLLRGRGLASSVHSSSINSNSNSNTVLAFLRNSIRGRRWGSSSTGNEFDDDDDDLFLEDDENEDEHFSACILWMDDNHRLEEWLAYHYYLLKLRYVVINVDPKSTTSPQAIVDRWNGKNKLYNNNNNHPLLEYDLNMTIALWNDTQYINPIRYEFEQAKIGVAKGDEKYRLATEYHKYRQPEFYKACSRHLISEREKQYQNVNSSSISSTINSTLYNNASQWTTYHDTDEFLAFEPESYDEWEVAGASTRQWHKYETPGYVLNSLNAIKKRGIREEEKRRMEHEEKNQQQFADQDNSNSNNNTSTIGARTTTPPLSGISCMVVPRYNFCSIELMEDETNKLLLDGPPRKGELPSSSDVFVPSEFVREKWLLENAKLKRPSAGETETTSKVNSTTIVRRFDTLRYQYQTPGLGNYGKSIVDLSQADVREFAEENAPWQTHRVIASICNNEKEEEKESSSQHRSKKIQRLVQNEHMQINHYLGSWDSYNARPNDARKGLSTSNNGNAAKWLENAKSYQNWLQKSRDTRGRSSIVVRPWLRGFIRLVGGPRIAAHLLQDAGIILQRSAADHGASEEGRRE